MIFVRFVNFPNRVKMLCAGKECGHGHLTLGPPDRDPNSKPSPFALFSHFNNACRLVQCDSLAMFSLLMVATEASGVIWSSSHTVPLLSHVIPSRNCASMWLRSWRDEQPTHLLMLLTSLLYPRCCKNWRTRLRAMNFIRCAGSFILILSRFATL